MSGRGQLGLVDLVSSRVLEDQLLTAAAGGEAMALSADSRARLGVQRAGGRAGRGPTAPSAAGLASIRGAAGLVGVAEFGREVGGEGA